jgi:hypothetical protein
MFLTTPVACDVSYRYHACGVTRLPVWWISICLLVFSSFFPTGLRRTGQCLFYDTYALCERAPCARAYVILSDMLAAGWVRIGVSTHFRFLVLLSVVAVSIYRSLSILLCARVDRGLRLPGKWCLTGCVFWCCIARSLSTLGPDFPNWTYGCDTSCLYNA